MSPRRSGLTAISVSCCRNCGSPAWAGRSCSGSCSHWPVIRGTLPSDDPRNRATIRAVTGELSEDGYVYRFRHDARPLHKSEGAFLPCGF